MPNNRLKAATVEVNYINSGENTSNGAAVIIDEISDNPFIYICKDDESSSSPVSNKLFLKLPGSDDIVEISKGAARLESPEGATIPGYYTYETLAAIIAGINSRLAALGSTKLTLPNVIEDAGYVLVPDISSTSFSDKLLVEEDVVPTVQQLEQAIAEMYGITTKDNANKDVLVDTIGEILNTDNRDSLAQLREDLTDLAEEMYYADHESDFFATNSRIDDLEDGLADGTVIAARANTLWDNTNSKLFSTAENVPVYFKDGQPVACGDSTGTGETPADGSVPINISGNAKTADQVNSSLTIQLNNGTITSGTNPNKFVFNGAAPKTVNITPAKIGAVAATKKASATATAETVKTIAFVLDGTKLTITTTS